MPEPSARRALLILDMQCGLFDGPEPPYEGERVLARINRLAARARAAGAPVLAARHTGPAGSPIAPGSPAWQLLPRLDVDAAHDIVFDKTRPSGFVGTGLEARLAQAGIGELVIVGMKTQYCVDANCRAAADLGLRPVLVADAHTCMDTPDLPAAAIIAHHNRTLGSAFAQLVTAEACRF
ncbi:cysteine hydrolase [Cupriavidus sp. USMAA2-4]|uniref:isochorismatase family protein n=1 Tax=unclassified Cupriavidus TaxID=2640874 RepID=UPI0008A68916|nr:MULTISPECIES: isochorismatase family protein [unclassified Cupriavidus]AOY96764.1 cysteine hydrolase [Cupriavidus sp. USMAA2-4]AOZ02832.1 cysteine hydrolase [Cupriavidus sp. USMAHM13]